MIEFKLLYRNTLGLSITSEERNRFKTKLKDIALSTNKCVTCTIPDANILVKLSITPDKYV